MQKFLRTLMLVAVMLLPFASHAQTCTGLTLPYAENFDAYTGNATGTTAPTGYPSITLPDCWTFLNMSDGTSAYPQVFLTSSTTYAVSGNCLFFKSSSTTPLYASMPDFGAQSGAWLLSFKYRNEGTTDANGTIIVGVMSDPSDATTFVALDTLNRTTTKTVVELIIPAGSVAAGGRVTFCYLGGTSNNYYAAIDDVTLDAPSCFPVSNVVVSDATANSITLTWTDAVNSGAQYSVFDMSGVNPSVIATLINGTTYTVTGLEGNTNYLLGVAANCSETSASTITEIMARTACPATIALPYVEEFNGYTGFQTYPYYGPSVLPACWIYWGNGENTAETSGTSVYYGGVAQYNGTSYGSMESNNPYLYLPIQLTSDAVTSSTGLGYATARGDVRYAVLPAFAESLSGLQMSFDYKMSSAYSATGAAAVLELGYVTNDDVTTFVSMQSYNAVTSIQHVVDLNLSTLAAAAPAGARLAFKFSGVHNGTGTSSYTNVGCGIDNITVEALPACSRALDVTVAAVTTNSVTLNWHHNDLNAAGTTYTVYNMADTTVVATGVNDTTYTVTGLTANTNYTFGVEANCAAGDAAITSVSGRTACAAEALPFSETFDASLSSNPCWRGASILYADGVTPTMGANSNWTYTSSASNGIEAGHYRVNIYGTSCYKWLITPEIDLTTATNPLLTFDAAFTVYTSTSTGPATGFESNDSQKFMILVSTNNGQTWTVASDIPLTSIASGSYLPQYVNLAAYAGETVRVAFYAQSTVSGGDNNLHIDNIAIDEVVGEICYPVTGLAASNITADGATLTWTGDAASYNVYVIAADTTLVQNVTTNTITLTGLAAMTQYTYGVRAVCTSSESDMVSVTFATACAAVEVPYTETFASTSATRNCWTFVSMNTGNDLGTSNGMGFYTISGRETWRFSSYSNHGGSNDYNQYGYSPVMNNTTTDSLHVKVVYATYSSSNILNFGYIAGADTVWALADFHTTGSSDFQTFEANLPANTTQLAVHYYGNYSYYAWIDSVEVTVATAGGDTTVVADSVHITYAVNDATMGTTNPAPGTHAYVEGEAFSVTAVPATGYHLADWQMTIDVPDYGLYTMMMGTDTLTLSDTASANYDGLILTAIFAADGGDTTVVECDPVTIPFVETFETTSTTADCWTSDGPGTWTIATGDYSASTGAYEGSLNAKITHGTTGDVTKLISPVLSGVTNGLQLTFAHIQRSWAGDIDNLAVYYRTSSDAAWQQVVSYTDAVAAWTVESVTIPGTIYQVAFEYTDHYGYGVGIDSIVFDEAPACLPVIGLTLDSQTATSANVHWVSTGATGYEVEVRQNEVPLTTVSVVIADTTAVISGLAIDNDYQIVVRSVCGSDYSPWSSALNVHIGYCVPNPTSRDAQGITGVAFGGMTNTTSHPSAAPYYGNYSAMAGTVPAGLTASVDITFATGYTYGTIIWVDWNNSLSFDADEVVYRGTSESTNPTTLTATFDIPATQAVGDYRMRIATADSYFDSYVSDPTSTPDPCFTASYAVAEDYTLTVSAAPSCLPVTDLTADSATATSIFLSWDGTATAYNIYTSTGDVVATGVTTTEYEVTGLTPMTGYTFGVYAVCGTDMSPVTTVTAATACGGATCNISIVGTDSYGDGWNGNAINVMQAGVVIGTFTLTSGSSATETFTVCSSAPVSFTWVSGNFADETSFEIKDGGDMVVYSVADGSTLTNGQVIYTLTDACPSCIPAAITVDTVTTTSVTISWTGTAASYDVYNGTILVANVTTNTYTFTGLTAATAYLFGVQAICSATDTAVMNTVMAYTACSAAAINLPFNETFNATSGTRNCWTSVDGDNDGFGWSTMYAGADQEMMLSFSYDNDEDEPLTPSNWLISPKLHTSAGSTVTMNWIAAAASSSWAAEHYGVYVSTTTADTTAFTMLQEWTLSAADANGTLNTIDLSAYAGQDIYVAFHHFNCTDQVALIIEDVNVYEGAFVPDTLTVTFAVNDATMGTTIPAPGTYQYITGDTVTFQALANPGYHFVGFVKTAAGVNDTTLDDSYVSFYFPAAVMMDYDSLTLTALFEAGNPDSMQVTIAVNDPTMGTTNPAPGVHYYYAGQPASLVAIPNTGNHLQGWAYEITVPGYGSIMQDTILAVPDFFDAFLDGGLLPADACMYEWTVTALFAPGEPIEMHDSVIVTTAVNDPAMGSITPAPGTHYYVEGDTAILCITPNPGYYIYAIQLTKSHPMFGTLNETITDPEEIAEFMLPDTMIVSAEMYGMTLSINVIFAAEGTVPNSYHVTVNYDVTRGTVTGGDEDYIEGSTVTLTAMAFNGYEFLAWVENGDTVGRHTVYTIDNIDADHTLTAVFVTATQGIEDVDMENVSIYSTDNVIVVSGAEGKDVVLFDVNGRMLSREASAAERVEFRVNNSGVYLVKVANAAAKRVVVIR